MNILEPEVELKNMPKVWNNIYTSHSKNPRYVLVVAQAGVHCLMCVHSQ